MRRPRPQAPESDAPSEEYAENMMDMLGIEPPGDVKSAPVEVVPKAPPSIYEVAGRLKKVAALVRVLRAADITAELAEHMTDRHWRDMAVTAGVKVPSAETRAVVIKTLKGEL